MALESLHIFDAEVVEFNIPGWVSDLATYRRWVEEDDTLDFGRVGYIKGSVWLDMSKEQLYTHNDVKSELTLVLRGLVKKNRLGRYFSDGVLLCNVQADISGQPDGMFVSNESLQNGQIVDIVGRRDGGYVELEGTPDLVIEVVSHGAIRKDKIRLRQAYWEAGIPEYWLIDARHEPLQFDILRSTAKGYVAARKQDGWIKSPTFGKSFRLTAELDERGRPEYTLAMR